MPLPPSTAAIRNPARTHTTGTPRWRASPAATPPMIGWRVSRVARRTGRSVGADRVVMTPSIVAGRRGPNHAGDPRSYPEPRPPRRGRDQGFPRWCTPRRWRTLDDMTTTPPDTSPPQGPAPDSGPRVGWDDIRDLARIRRSRSDRKVAGVAGGLGRHLDIDPVILRVAFVVLTFFGGVGLLLYVALWLLLPDDGKDWAKIKLDRRSRTVALVMVGILALVLLFSHGWWG